MKHADFLAALDHPRIEKAIHDAEKNTSGEIRVHVQPRCVGGDLDFVSKRTFERLGMTKTKQRNGVLLFIASEEQRFEILGDSGIHAVVGEGFWNAIAAELHDAFRAGSFTDGIIGAVTQCGEKLMSFFPYEKGDVNELPNTISVE